VPAPVPVPVEVKIDAPTRRSLVWETRFVLAAFLVGSVGGAIVPLVQHAYGVNDIARFPSFVNNNPLINMILGMLTYISLGAIVPVALLLLARTGNKPRTIGLGWPSFVLDIWPGIGLGLASYISEIVLLIPFAQLLAHHKGLETSPAVGSVPHYYIIYGIFVSAVTAITEEVIVNGYLLVRLEQLGWTNRSALILSLVLRMSYHIYYGITFPIVVLPFGYFVTRSFQKHKRLNRAIATHFLYDAVLFIISIL
jgi:membrane protease YdiL (CAAX protease family)